MGIVIDNKLTWRHHIEYIKTKLSKGIGLLSKIRHYIPKNTLICLYYSFINSYIEYGLLNWSSAPTTNLDVIRLCTKKAIRLITFKNKTEHTTPLFKELGILPMDHLIKHKQATFMWKLTNNLIPTPVKYLFKPSTSLIDTRQGHKYLLPAPRLNISQRHITYSGVKTWNTVVPPALKATKKLKISQRNIENI